MQHSLEGEESLSNRIKNFRKTFNTEDKMDEFDRELFESLVEKVAIGKDDSEDNPLPYRICFILKTGLKFDEMVLKSIKKNETHTVDSKLCYSDSNEVTNLCSLHVSDTC